LGPIFFLATEVLPLALLDDVMKESRDDQFEGNMPPPPTLLLISLSLALLSIYLPLMI
jgi:hypothetical protein